MAVYRLSEDEIWFPNPSLAEDDGLMAVGGDLSVERLLTAYTNGIFPWYNPEDEIMWWCPKERFVIIPGEIHISKSMKKAMKRAMAKEDFDIVFDRDFKETIHQCRMMREYEEGTWISDDMEAAYNRMFEKGYATSAEVWEGQEMIGGLYGVSIGRCFFGESMFSKKENASKMALIALSQVLSAWGFEFIDCQFHTEHLESMGGRYISYEEYMKLMRRGLRPL